ncbi:MAG TPA: heavy metal translocating P-type ATPase, partial [Bryobacteraceae bacterium]|nr:heavy metal translocating P-type ATPase [Bryobacteraceae bacterium]
HASTKLMLKTEDRSRQMLANMFGQQPRTVHVMVDGHEVEKPFEELIVGDVLVVHAGQMVPVDGAIWSGTAAVDQHVLTGEAQPAEKGPGDRVFAATVMLAGRVEVKVEKTGAETAAAQIRDLLANTTDFRTAIQARWVGVANQTVLPTLGLAALALPILGPVSALAVINSNYVAVLKVASPLGMLNFLQRASRAGILIKDGRALEAACKVDTVVFDKTGTLTEPEPHLGEIHTFGDTHPDDLLTCAAAVEANQAHPVARAILSAARASQLSLPDLDDARYDVGYGIQARIGERMIHVGSARYMAMQNIELPPAFGPQLEVIHSRGGSVIYVASNGHAAGALELRPTLRPEAKEVVARLKEMGLTLHIISGDHAAPTAALASDLGIEHFFAEVLPQDKSRLIRELQQKGRKVCFVGDGINDAIALKQADVSVSIRGASSLATDTAQMILMDESLRQLNQVFEVAHDYEANLKALLTTTFVPGLVSLGSVFFLGAGNATALLLFNLSMIAGLVNAIWPALQNLEAPLTTSVPGGKETAPAPCGDPIRAGAA